MRSEPAHEKKRMTLIKYTLARIKTIYSLLLPTYVFTEFENFFLTNIAKLRLHQHASEEGFYFASLCITCPHKAF